MLSMRGSSQSTSAALREKRRRSGACRRRWRADTGCSDPRSCEGRVRCHRLPGGNRGRAAFADGEFPAAYCCDVLEHVDDVGRTVAEIARVLEPGGVFLYDTVNRTMRSK